MSGVIENFILFNCLTEKAKKFWQSLCKKTVMVNIQFISIYELSQ